MVLLASFSVLINPKYFFDLAGLIKKFPGDDYNPLTGDKESTRWFQDFFTDEFESEKNGMPFYFRDLRDNHMIFFRAYITGLTETISPNWIFFFRRCCDFYFCFFYRMYKFYFSSM